VSPWRPATVTPPWLWLHTRRGPQIQPLSPYQGAGGASFISFSDRRSESPSESSRWPHAKGPGAPASLTSVTNESDPFVTKASLALVTNESDSRSELEATVTGNAATVSPFASPRRPTTPPRLWLHTRQVTDLVNAVTTEVIARRAAGGAAAEGRPGPHESPGLERPPPPAGRACSPRAGPRCGSAPHSPPVPPAADSTGMSAPAASEPAGGGGGGGGVDGLAGAAGLGTEERLARLEGLLAGLDAKLDAKLDAVLQGLSACREPAPAAGLLPLPPLAAGRAPGRRGRTSRAGQ
jgi:hypothetical protein